MIRKLVLMAVGVAMLAGLVIAEEPGKMPDDGWAIKIRLNAPRLLPQAVQFSLFDSDPAEHFRTMLARVKPLYRQQLVPAANDPKRLGEIKRAQIRASWENVFRKVTGDLVSLVFPGKEGETVVSSNAAAGRKWLVTKIGLLDEKPVCWSLPVEVKPGQEVVLDLTPENAFLPESLYEELMK